MGYAWRMSELHAATGVVQMGRLDEFIAVRQRIARLYDAALATIPRVTAQPMPAGCLSNYYKYVAFLDDDVDRPEFKERMASEAGIGMSGEVYASPLHRHPI